MRKVLTIGDIVYLRCNCKWAAELGHEFAGTLIGIINCISSIEEDEISNVERGWPAMAIGLNCCVFICSDDSLLGGLDRGVDVLNKIRCGGV